MRVEIGRNFRQWLAHAKYGASFVYMEDVKNGLPERDEHVADIRRLTAECAKAGLVMLFQRRRLGGSFDYVAVRTSASCAAWLNRVSGKIPAPAGDERLRRIADGEMA